MAYAKHASEIVSDEDDVSESSSDEDDEIISIYRKYFKSMVESKWDRIRWHKTSDVPDSLRAGRNLITAAYHDIRHILVYETEDSINTPRTKLFLTHKTHWTMLWMKVMSKSLYAIARPGAPLTRTHEMLQSTIGALHDWLVQCGFELVWDTLKIEEEYTVSRKMNMPNLFETVFFPVWKLLKDLTFPPRFQDTLEQVMYDELNLERAACIDVNVADVLETAQILILRLNGFIYDVETDKALRPHCTLLVDVNKAIGRLIKQSDLILKHEANGGVVGDYEFEMLYERKYKRRVNRNTCCISLPLPRSYEVPLV